MIFRRIIFASLAISAVVALSIAFVVLAVFRFSFSETIATFGFSFVAVFAVALMISLFETQLHKGNPWKDLFVLSFACLVLALAASVESLSKNVTALLFLPFDILFLLTMARSYQLMSIFQKSETKDLRKVRDLPLQDQILIALHFIGFFVFLGLAVYFLRWIV